jgi:acyl-CoA thioester hydrolase
MNNIQTYLHQVHYYETDQMKIVHHSNYIRWFEEARIDYLKQVGLPYILLEEKGIISPVLEIHCQYLSMVHFDDTVAITCSLESFTGVKFSVSYEIKDASNGTLRAIGKSYHCFVNEDGKPIHLKKEHKDVYDVLKSLIK